MIWVISVGRARGTVASSTAFAQDRVQQIEMVEVIVAMPVPQIMKTSCSRLWPFRCHRSLETRGGDSVCGHPGSTDHGRNSRGDQEFQLISICFFL